MLGVCFSPLTTGGTGLKLLHLYDNSRESEMFNSELVLKSKNNKHKTFILNVFFIKIKD